MENCKYCWATQEACLEAHRQERANPSGLRLPACCCWDCTHPVIDSIP